MAGLNQLPSGAEGFAALSLIYTSASWICSVLLIWCARLYREAWSYISLVSYFTLISDTASIIQQAYDTTFYRDIVAQQFYRKITYLDDPELAIANGSFGLDLVLYYIQYYAYNVEAMLVMFWAFELAQSVYGLSTRRRLKPLLKKINTTGKAIAVVLPLITILLLRAPSVQKVFFVFILIADLPLMISLAVSSCTMVAILVRYIQSRKQISNWTPQENSTAATSETAETAQTTQTARSAAKRPQKVQGLYDRWLMVRFTIAFVILALFEVTNTLFQLQSMKNNQKDATLSSPDFSVGRARTTLLLFLPGVTPGIFVFLVFGTTSGCRAAIKDTIIPKAWRSKTTHMGRYRTWRPWKRSGSPGDLDQEAHDLFASSSDNKLHSSDHVRPLPVATIVSKYNRAFNASHDAVKVPMHQPIRSRNGNLDHFARNEKMMLEEGDIIPLRSLTSLEKIKENYYAPTPEESDDSGPILPIMDYHHDPSNELRDRIRAAGTTSVTSTKAHHDTDPEMKTTGF